MPDETFTLNAVIGTKGITHQFISGVDDGVDDAKVRPGNWNASHDITGLTFRTKLYTFNVAAGATHTIPDGSVARQGGALLYCSGTDGMAMVHWYRDGTFNMINGQQTPNGTLNFRHNTFSAGASGFSIYLSSNSAGATINIKNNNAYARDFRLFEFSIAANVV